MSASPDASAVQPSARATRGPYFYFVKWCRRITSVAVWVFLIRWWFIGRSPVSELENLLAPATAHLPVLSAGQLVVILAIAWYAFLSQLKVGWAIVLPAYLLLFPVVFVTARLAKMVYRSASAKVTALASVAEGARASPTQRRLKLPSKRLWLLLFFMWLLVLRTVHAAWAAWILPLLMVPIWLWCMKLAYRAATAPASLVDLALKGAAALLDSVAKQVQEAQAKGQPKEEGITKYIFGFTRAVLRRYSAEKLLTVVHRESLLLFSAALVATLVASAFFWGFVANAVAATDRTALQPYQFFTEWRLPEYVLWALGCMTTTVGFPDAPSSVAVKALHAAVLMTGVFQFTYLLACFSIMASAEGERLVRSSSDQVGRLALRLEEVGKLEEAARAPVIEGEVVTEAAVDDAEPQPAAGDMKDDE